MRSTVTSGLSAAPGPRLPRSVRQREGRADRRSTCRQPVLQPGARLDIGPRHRRRLCGWIATPPGDGASPEIDDYLASADAAWETLAGALSGNEPAPPSVAAAGFFYGYYSGGVALVNALNAVEGDLSNNHEALRAELAGMTLWSCPMGRSAWTKTVADRRRVPLPAGPRWRGSGAGDRGLDPASGSDLRWHFQRGHPRPPPGTSLDVRRPTCRGAGARYRLSTVSRRSR